MSRARAAACSGFLLAATWLAAAGSAAAAEQPRLVLLLVVDQLRPDRLDPGLPGGLGRLLREGRVYPEAALEHAITETCPGHAAVATGRQPGAAGIPGNAFFGPEEGRLVYCVEDGDPRYRVLGGGAPRSPRRLRVPALGDWLKAAQPDSRVFAVSGKDRAAILLGGLHADAAYWLEDEGGPRFTTSAWYREELPAWALRFNGSDPLRDGFLAGLPERWEHGAAAASDGRLDDCAGEAKRFGRTSGHPLRASDPEVLAEQLAASPYLDDATLDFARTLVEQEGLGSGPSPDLLALGLSATDRVGHLYGPFSQEAADALARLDAGLGAFLAALEARLGQGRILAVLTSDHGVLPLPEWLAARGEATCPVEGGRTGVRWLGFRLLWKLHWKLSPLRWPRAWLHFAGPQLVVDRSLAARRGVAVADAVEVAERFLQAQPAVAEVWTRAEILERDSDVARLYLHSYDPERSGDLAVQLAPGCLITEYDTGTTHGTPYLYDRAVPLVFWGAGIEPAVVSGPAASLDVAPTLARRLGIPAPAVLDGRVLFE